MKQLVLVSFVAFGSALLPISGDAQGPLAPEVDSAEVNGFSLVYRVLGDGDPLVLLHGFFGSGENWESIFDELAPHYRLIVPDLRGHGRSTNPSGRFTHRQSALDVFGLLDQLGIGKVKAMGISTGGMTLLHMATSQPERIEAMTLIGATSYFPEQARAILRARSPDNLPPERLEAMSEQARALNRQFSAFGDSYDDMNFTAPFLSTIEAHTLIVHGDRDQFFPVSIPVEQYAAIPNSYLWIVPNGGHVPLIGTERGDMILTDNVLEFFGGKWRR